jgi:hypothetical protein
MKYAKTANCGEVFLLMSLLRELSFQYTVGRLTVFPDSEKIAKKFPAATRPVDFSSNNRPKMDEHQGNDYQRVGDIYPGMNKYPGGDRD